MLKESIITPEQGTKLAMHVFAPGMKYRILHPEIFLPNVCLRWSTVGFQGMKLYEKVELLGPSTLEMLNAPLSGTSGRAQVILLTEHPVRVWSHLDNPPMIDTVRSDNVMDVLKEVIARYDRTEHHENRRMLDERIKKISRVQNHKRRERPQKAYRT